MNTDGSQVSFPFRPICVLFLIVAHTSFAGFLKVDPDDSLERPWEAKGRDPGRPLLVFISGGGSATDEQRHDRASHFIFGEVVIFKPSFLGYYTEGAMRPLRDFLSDRRNLGRNLHFLVSSAGGSTFENWIYDPLYLPERVGSVILAQPFAPWFLTFNPERPELSDKIKPDLHLVYDIRMGPVRLGAIDERQRGRRRSARIGVYRGRKFQTRRTMA